MRQFGLIGFPLTHSFSRTYFKEKFKKEKIDHNTVYLNFPISQIDELPSLLEKNIHLLGLNVTIPYKESVIPFLQKLDKISSEINAVNTIKIVRSQNNYQLLGFNTDEYGFKRSLMKFIEPGVKKALILGTGGASKAVKYVLENLGFEYLMVSRSEKNGDIIYKKLDKSLIQSVDLIINTTPLGTFPDINSKPDIPYQYINEKHFLFDLVYNPVKTAFLNEGVQRNASIQNGYDMLIFQAEESWRIWNA